jgi:Flp pilus assembly protein TadD
MRRLGLAFNEQAVLAPLILAELGRTAHAVNAEDALHYDKPPGWILPVRHSLGANLMQAGRFAEAEQVYRDDLALARERLVALWLGP